MLMHMLDQGSAGAGLGCNGDCTGSGLKWGATALLGLGAGHSDTPQGSGSG